jgi:putative spermidine/putrescine transport system permease protein
MALPPYTTRPERVWHYAHWTICWLIFLYLVAPVLVVLPLSFNPEPYFSYPLKEFSLRWWEFMVNSPHWRLAARNSVLIAVSVTVLSTVLGTLAALGLSRGGFPGKGAIVGLLVSPLIVPTIITAVGIYFFLARLEAHNTIFGIILAHTILATPFVVILVTATLVNFDKNQARAAANLGATPVQAFFKVTMPLIMPGLASGAIFAFVTSFDEVIVVIFLAGPGQLTLPKQMWDGVREQINPSILAVSCLLVFVSLVALTLMEWIRRYNLRLRGVRE